MSSLHAAWIKTEMIHHPETLIAQHFWKLAALTLTEKNFHDMKPGRLKILVQLL